MPTDRTDQAAQRSGKPSGQRDSQTSHRSGATERVGSAYMRRAMATSALLTLLVAGGATLAISRVVPADETSDLVAAADTATPQTAPPDATAGTVADTTAPQTTTTAPPTTLPPTTTVPGPLPCPAADGSSPQVRVFAVAPPLCIDPTATYSAVITTSEGTIKLKLDTQDTPDATNVFVYLARYHFYDGLPFNRQIPEFLIQTGDPSGTGGGGPGFSFPDELRAEKGYRAGDVAFANGNPAQPNSNGSQFFIVTGASAKDLDPLWPLFAEVTSGLDVARTIAAYGPANGQGTPAKTVTVDSIAIEAANETLPTTTASTASASTTPASTPGGEITDSPLATLDTSSTNP